MLPNLRSWCTVAMATLAVAACSSSPPPPDELTAAAARLDAVIPIVEALRVTDFEASADCRNLGYARGAFGDMDAEGCQRDGTGPFDAVALADHARLAGAIVAAEVEIDRLRSATYAADGTLETAWFSVIDASVTDDWEYLFDPTGVVPKPDAPDTQDFTRLDDLWWFVRSRDD